MDFKVKIAILAVTIPIVTMLSLIGYDQLSEDTLIIERNGELEIRIPLSEGENRLLAEKLIDIIIEKYDSGETIQSLNGDPLGFRLINDEIRYVFILDKKLDVISHYLPQGTGATFESINAVRTFDQVIEELESEGQTWIHYKKYNPNNNNYESKQSLLKLHNGIVFGSGFYN